MSETRAIVVIRGGVCDTVIGVDDYVLVDWDDIMANGVTVSDLAEIMLQVAKHIDPNLADDQQDELRVLLTDLAEMLADRLSSQKPLHG